jgi:hypothetical protein
VCLCTFSLHHCVVKRLVVTFINKFHLDTFISYLLNFSKLEIFFYLNTNPLFFYNTRFHLEYQDGEKFVHFYFSSIFLSQNSISWNASPDVYSSIVFVFRCSINNLKGKLLLVIILMLSSTFSSAGSLFSTQTRIHNQLLEVWHG